MIEEKGKSLADLQTTQPSKFRKHTTFTLCLAEIIGTGMLLFMGCLGCVGAFDPMPIPHHLSSVAFGLTVLTIVQLFGHISGAHLNPQVTLASVLLGVLDLKLLPFYVGSQFIGALLGFSLFRVLVPFEYIENEKFDPMINKTIHTVGMCSTVPHEKVSTFQALAFEIVITCILILVCGAVWDKRNETKQDSVAVRFGLIIATIAMVAGPYTGASMNTARSFAPALLNGDWNQHWIYWVGPTIGALVGAGMYITLFNTVVEKTLSEDEEMELVTEKPRAVEA